MRVPDSGLYLDNPAKPLLRALISYQGITDAAGAVDGGTLVCGGLANEPPYDDHFIKILAGNAAGQVRLIKSHVGNTLYFDRGFQDTVAAGGFIQIGAGIPFIILSGYEPGALYYGIATANGAVDGSTIVDTILFPNFPADDQLIGNTVRIIGSVIGSEELETQEREIYDYDSATSTLSFDVPFSLQVLTNIRYAIIRNRPSSGGSPAPPEPQLEEKAWQLADYDNFDVPDPTADTERWSSEYQQGAADGSADINNDVLTIDINAAALAAAQYGVRRLYPCNVRKFFTTTDIYVVIDPDVNPAWAGIALSRGIAWDGNNYVAIYKRRSAAVNQIAVEYNLAGAGAVITNILATTDAHLGFKIERNNNVWRLYYSLTQAPHHRWVLALEIEDPTNAMTDQTSIYLTVYNPEDVAPGQQVTATYNSWEYWESLGNLGDVVTNLKINPTEATYNHPNGVAEQTAFTIALARPVRLKSMFFDMSNLTQNTTIRIKYQIDGANYRTIETFNWTAGMDDGVFFREITVNHNVQVSFQSAVAEGAARDIPYQYFLEG